MADEICGRLEVMAVVLGASPGEGGADNEVNEGEGGRFIGCRFVGMDCEASTNCAPVSGMTGEI